MKNTLISKLWCPFIINADPFLYPRRRKNKRMKIFTLTDWNHEEIEEFKRNCLTKPDLIVAWTHSYQNRCRLETDLGKSRVLGSDRYEDAIIRDPQSIYDYFPFDIINLNFNSQDPLQINQRIEKEIQSIEHTIKFQNEKSNGNLVLIYTTKIDSNPLDPNLIKKFSDSISVPGWYGLSINQFKFNITCYEDKFKFIEYILKDICTKYSYNNSFDKPFFDLSKSNGHIYSIAGLLKRSI